MRTAIPDRVVREDDDEFLDKRLQEHNEDLKRASQNDETRYFRDALKY